MKNRFFNRGYFNASINYTTDSIYKKFTINYEVLHGHQYTIDSIDYSSDGTGLGNVIENTRATSSLDKGNPYILDNLKKERERIENVIKVLFMVINPPLKWHIEGCHLFIAKLKTAARLKLRGLITIFSPF